MSAEHFMRPITDAARYVRARLPRGHAFDLHDLVGIGYEHVARYVDPGTHPTVAFICAKQGMLYAARKWQGRNPHGRKRKTIPDPSFRAFDEEYDVWDVWRRSSTLDIESLIDAKRALLGMRLQEAVSWYSHHWLGEELDHLEDELGVSGGRIRQYIAEAREKLKAAWRGVAFETEEDRAARERARVAARDVSRAAANAKMLAERRRRYAELRGLGLGKSEATRCAGSKARYLTRARQLTAQAAE